VAKAPTRATRANADDAPYTEDAGGFAPEGNGYPARRPGGGDRTRRG
jgi:hypothetical protein